MIILLLNPNLIIERVYTLICEPNRFVLGVTSSCQMKIYDLECQKRFFLPDQ